MADLSKVRIGGADYDLKDAAARTAIGDSSSGLIKSLNDEIAARTSGDNTLDGKITAEANARTSADTALDARITNLEARGRFLSDWNTSTGAPTTYPTIPAGATSPYVYTYKSGDYYIVGAVGAKGANYQPTGSSITATKSGETWSWEVGKTADTREISVGDYYTYDGAKWILISNSQKTVNFANIAGEVYENAKLRGELNKKINGVSESATDGKIKVTQKTYDAEGVESTVDTDVAVHGLKSLAFKVSATGTVAGQTISGVKAAYTPEGTVEVADLTQTATAATLTKGDYTPAGTVTGNAIKGGAITVTVKDATAATAVTDLTYENYTPAGTVSAKSVGGTAEVLTSASFVADNDGTQITGSVSKPTITVSAGTEKTFVTDLTGGSVASLDTTKFDGGAAATWTGASAVAPTFTEGAFTPASIKTQVAFAKAGITAAVGTGADAECLIFTTAETANAVTDINGGSKAADTFTSGSVNFGTFDGGSAATIGEGFFTPNVLQGKSTGTVHDTPTAALDAAPTFTGGKFRVTTDADTVLKDVEFAGTAAAVKLTGAKYLKQEIDEASFTGTAATLGFSGTKSENVLVTGVTYDKATSAGATFTGTAGEASVGNIVVSDKNVTVS